MRVVTIDESTGKRVYNRTEIADLCGVSTQTVSLWEKNQRIPISTRDENGYRYWYDEEVELIKEYAKNPVKCGKKKKIV